MDAKEKIKKFLAVHEDGKEKHLTR